MAKSSVSRRDLMKGVAVVGGGVLRAVGVTYVPLVQEAVPMAAMRADKILAQLGLMPGLPPEAVTSFTRTDADTRFQGDDDIYDNNGELLSLIREVTRRGAKNT